MSSPIIQAGVICLALALMPACVPAPESEVDLEAEERVIRELWEEVLAVYESRDAKAMADMCDEPFLNFGIVHRDRESIESQWEGFLGSLQDTRLNILEDIGLEFVTPEVAILQARIEFTNLPPDADGNPQRPRQFFAANVVVKKDGRWLRKGAFLTEITAAS